MMGHKVAPQERVKLENDIMELYRQEKTFSISAERREDGMFYFTVTPHDRGQGGSAGPRPAGQPSIGDQFLQKTAPTTAPRVKSIKRVN